MDEENQIEVPLLTYNSLYNLLREEKRSKSLQSIPNLFYEALKIFFTEKKKEILKYKTDENLRGMQKEKLIFRNSEKISKEFLNLRCKKIANIGIKNSLFGDESLSENNILDKEKDFLNDVMLSVKKLK